MLTAKDYRQRAWTALSGKWGNMAVCALIFELILGACSGITVTLSSLRMGVAIFSGIGGIGTLLLTGPLTLGFSMLALNVIRGSEIKIETLFDGFKNFVNSFVLYLLNTIFIALWSLLLIVPGIIKAISYSMSYFILVDHPDMQPNEARKQSMAMMQGNKWRYFCLQISFIGWWLLCVLTVGILSFWITPYVQTANAEFYQSLLAAPPAANAQEVPALTEASAQTGAAAPAEEEKTVAEEQVQTHAEEAPEATAEEAENSEVLNGGETPDVSADAPENSGDGQ